MGWFGKDEITVLRLSNALAEMMLVSVNDVGKIFIEKMLSDKEVIALEAFGLRRAFSSSRLTNLFDKELGQELETNAVDLALAKQDDSEMTAERLLEVQNRVQKLVSEYNEHSEDKNLGPLWYVSKETLRQSGFGISPDRMVYLAQVSSSDMLIKVDFLEKTAKDFKIVPD